MDKMANFMAKAIVAGVLFNTGVRFSERIGHYFESVTEFRNTRNRLEKIIFEKITGETIPDKEPCKTKNKIGFSVE